MIFSAFSPGGVPNFLCDRIFDFADDNIEVAMYPSSSEDGKVFTPEDFPEFEFKKVVDTSFLNPHTEVFYRSFTLYLTNPSKENVLLAMEALRKRDDVVRTLPDYSKILLKMQEENFNYDERCVMVIMSRETSRDDKRVFTPADFPEANFSEVRDISVGNSTHEFYRKVLFLRYAEPPNNDVNHKVAYEISKRTDVEYTEPSFLLNK